MVGKRLVNTGGAEVFDPLQNFETVTYTGNGGTQKITGYIRKGAAFNGSSSSIVNTSFGISGNAARSYSAWVYTNGSTTGTICGVGNHGVAGQSMYLYIDQSTSTWSLWGFTAAYDLENNSVAAIGSLSNGWHHFVLTWDASSTFKLYIDGSLADTKTKSATYNTPAEFAIGRWYDSGYYFNSKIDQVRIFNKAISSSEVTTLYNETYDSSTKSTTDIFNDGSGVALYELDEDANDTGTTPYGTGAIDGGQSAVFNGSSSRVDTTFTWGTTTEMSVSLWFNTTSTKNTNVMFWDSTNGSVTNGRILVGMDGSYWYFGMGNGSSFWYDASSVSTSGYQDGNWHHLVQTVNGTTHKLYLDGSLIATKTASVSAGTAGQTTVFLGANSPTNPTYDGKLDQVRIYDTALSASDVEALASETNVPTANLVAHYKLDGNANDETGSYNGTPTNITYSDPAEFPLIAYNGTPTNVNFLGMAFQPDFVWIKSRNSTDFNLLFDSVRGFNFLSSNTTSAEDTTNVVTLSSYDTNGFTTGNDNGSINGVGDNYVAWCWKAGGAAVSNTNGTITSTVSANPDAGFSIVKYVGTGATASVGHGLSAKPELVFIKKTSTTGSWVTFSDATGVFSFAFLNTDDAFADYSSNMSWNSSVLNLNNGGDQNGSGATHIAYFFHSVDGYQKVGSYSGSSSNVSVVTGFEPRFLLIKRASGSANWAIFDSVRDTANPRDLFIRASTNNAEESSISNILNFTSNGFEVTIQNTGFNAAGETYIYLAIA